MQENKCHPNMKMFTESLPAYQINAHSYILPSLNKSLQAEFSSDICQI